MHLVEEFRRRIALVQIEPRSTSFLAIQCGNTCCIQAVMCKILSLRYYIFILKIEDTILSCIFKILFQTILSLYLQDTFSKYLAHHCIQATHPQFNEVNK